MEIARFHASPLSPSFCLIEGCADHTQLRPPAAQRQKIRVRPAESLAPKFKFILGLEESLECLGEQALLFAKAMLMTVHFVVLFKWVTKELV